MRFRLKVLSPLHIGTGLKLGRSEYLCEGGKFLRISLDGLVADSAFRSDFERNLGMLRETSRYGNWPSHLRRLARSYVKYALPCDEAFRGGVEVNEFVKTGGKFYVPGSSIKGSILSALYWFELKKLAENEAERKRLIRDLTNPPHERKERQKLYKELTDRVFGLIAASPGKDRFYRWLSVTDSSTTEQAAVLRGEVASGRRRIELGYEALLPGCELEIELTSQTPSFSELDLIRVCDDFYTRVLEEDIAWSRSMNLDLGLDGLLGQKHKIRVGQGSSSLATSLLILAVDLGVARDYLRAWRVAGGEGGPRTRKLVEVRGKKMMMGWCTLSPRTGASRD